MAIALGPLATQRRRARMQKLNGGLVGPMDRPADIDEEAREVLAVGAAADVPIWLIGGLAVHFSIPSGHAPLFVRTYKDIDLVVMSRKRKAAAALLQERGYQPDLQFNFVNGHRRMLFWDEQHARQLDVFVEAFSMCHTIPLRDRLIPGQATIPRAELLLTKLQIIELNEKDQADILNLVFHSSLTPGSDSGIDPERIAQLCAHDWGLWRTTTANLDNTLAAVATANGLDSQASSMLLKRFKTLRARIDAHPKPAKWKLRDRLGDRLQWYEKPEEV